MNNPVYNTKSGGVIIANPVTGQTGWMETESGTRVLVSYDKGGVGLVELDNGLSEIRFAQEWVTMDVLLSRKTARSLHWRKSTKASVDYKFRKRQRIGYGSREPIGLYGDIDRDTVGIGYA